MKKFLYAAFVVILIAGSFWAGLWYSNRKAANNQPPVEQSTAASVDKENAGDTEKSSDAESSIPSDTLIISPERQQLIGVRTGVAEKGVVTKRLRLLGKVAADETRVFKVKTAVDGIIREVYSGTTGSLVKKGQPLASYYSPEIYAAAQGYLIAVRSDRYGSLQVQVTKSRLEFLGMSPEQIEELRKNGVIEEKIMLLSPATGFVLSRDVSPDLRFQKGEELYRIAALDRVWVLADIYETEGRHVRPGASVTIHHPLLNKKLSARVSKVLPLFDPTTRTLKVRIEADNPGFVLRPDMFVDVELPVDMPAAITVPSDAVLDAGLKKIVFVDHGDGILEPRKVETGLSFGDRVEIMKGLEQGERIVISGTFLIDSEMRLQSPSGYD
jgi:membrane fusion protein, copper/silver efflux system